MTVPSHLAQSYLTRSHFIENGHGEKPANQMSDHEILRLNQIETSGVTPIFINFNKIL